MSGCLTIVGFGWGDLVFVLGSCVSACYCGCLVLLIVSLGCLCYWSAVDGVCLCALLRYFAVVVLLIV